MGGGEVKLRKIGGDQADHLDLVAFLRRIRGRD
jgi:hypothetical protein